jgi:hypothetical protein
LGVLANFSKIHRVAPGLEEQEAVEVLEEDRVGLMDRTEDGLTGCGKFL